MDTKNVYFDLLVNAGFDEVNAGVIVDDRGNIRLRSEMLLLNLGFKRDKRFSYIIDAIELMYSRNFPKFITLYSELSKKYDVTPATIEKGIFRGISDSEIYNYPRIFGFIFEKSSKKLTTTTFLLGVSGFFKSF